MDGIYLDSIQKQIIESPLNADGTYVYSDLGFIMLAEIIQRKTGVTIDHYVDSVFYKPLGLRHLGQRALAVLQQHLDGHFEGARGEGAL